MLLCHGGRCGLERRRSRGRMMIQSRRRRTGQEEQVDGDNKADKCAKPPGLASSKVYSNVIFHYITEAGTQQLQPHCGPGTYTQCHSSSSCHIRKNTADTQAFKSHFINNAWVISTSIYLPRLKIAIRVLAKDTY